MEMEQYSRNRNVEITNLPDGGEQETKEELLVKIEKIANKANIPFQKDSIGILHRQPRMDKDKNKARKVVIQFKDRTSRTQCLQKKRHGVKVSDITDSGDPTPIYINEHLTPERRACCGKPRMRPERRDMNFCGLRMPRSLPRKTPIQGG